VEALATLDQTLAMGFSAATSWLLGAVRSDESPTVRHAAYVAVLRAVAPDEVGSVYGDDFDPDRDIDWDLLHGVLPEGA
jgi:hypothetical protein